MRLFFIICFTLLFQVDNFAQWHIHEDIPTTKDLYSITFPSENIGYAVGEKVVIKSTTSGDTWETLDIPNELDAFFGWKSVHFINETEGFVAGYGGLMKTNDGGMTWAGMSNSQNNYTSIFFNTSNIGYTTDLDGMVNKTTDGGDNWVSTKLDAYQLNDVYFINEVTGYCVGFQYVGMDDSRGKIFKSDNGGISWFEIMNTYRVLNEIRFVNDNFGIAVGSYGWIAITNDGGINWDQQNICDTCVLTSVLFQNDTSILIAGYTPAWIEAGNPQHAVIYHSSNSGTNWNIESVPFTDPLHSITKSNDLNIFCAGLNGLILRNANYTNVSDHDKALQLKYDLSIYPNPTSNFVRINYKLISPSFVKISITDYMGKELIQVSNNSKNSGTHETIVNLNNKEDGIYFCEIIINENRMVHKIIKTNGL